jgi:hypothetical protein
MTKGKFVMIDQRPLNTELLMSIEAELEEPLFVGDRCIVYVTGGSFEGPRIKGRIVPGGGDWLTVRPDGSMTVDSRVVLETDDGELIYSHYLGRIIWTPEMYNMDRVERTKVDPSTYYSRIVPVYETSSDKYAWLNNIVAVGVGRIAEKGPFFSVYEVK